MSLTHIVTIHCDSCGNWIHGDQQSTRQRRRDGWLSWRSQSGDGPWRHLCPTCNLAGKTTSEGERPDAATS